MMSAKFPRWGEVGHIWPTVYIKCMHISISMYFLKCKKYDTISFTCFFLSMIGLKPRLIESAESNRIYDTVEAETCRIYAMTGTRPRLIEFMMELRRRLKDSLTGLKPRLIEHMIWG